MIKYKIGKGKLLGYRIGNDGSVWSRRKPGRRWPGRPVSLRDTWTKLKQVTTPKGYKRVTLFFEGERRVWSVHKLVLTAFVGRRPEGMECRHLDGNPTNNQLDNLCWGTKYENLLDRIKHGKNSQEIPYMIRLIKMALARNCGIKMIAKVLGISPKSVRSIRDGKTWHWIKMYKPETER